MAKNWRSVCARFWSMLVGSLAIAQSAPRICICKRSLEHRIALTTADIDAARRAEDLYHQALGMYEKDSPLYALCLSDYARLNSGMLDNYDLAMRQFDELLKIKDASPAALVANLCAKAEAYNAQDDFRKANDVYEQALTATEQLADGHPLTGYVHKAYGWNLLDHWMVEKVRTHFKKSQDIQSRNSDLGNPLAKIEYFHARHGLALADRYSGRAKLARQSYRYLIEEVREEIAKKQSSHGRQSPVASAAVQFARTRAPTARSTKAF